MKNRNPRPQWWRLYSLVLAAVAGLMWTHRLGLPADAERVLQISLMAVFFGLTVAWLNANAAAFLLADIDEAARPVPQAESAQAAPEWASAGRRPEPPALPKPRIYIRGGDEAQSEYPQTRPAPTGRGLD